MSNIQVTESRLVLAELRNAPDGLAIADLMNILEWGKVRVRNRLWYLRESGRVELKSDRWYATPTWIEYRERLLNSELSPEGAWIECGKVPGKDWNQAYWKSNEPIFDGQKRKYIGSVYSDAHLQAIASLRRRDDLEAIERLMRNKQ